MPRKAGGGAADKAAAKALATQKTSGSIQKKDAPAAAKPIKIKAPPVDDMCPGHEAMHIWIDPDAKAPWCAMTNQTNVGANNNKVLTPSALQLLGFSFLNLLRQSQPLTYGQPLSCPAQHCPPSIPQPFIPSTPQLLSSCSATPARPDLTDAAHGQYYLLQLTQSNINSNEYYAWFRWGRVGATAGTTKEGPFGLEAAKSSYCKKFKDKTKNDWNAVLRDPKSFKPASGKYTLVEMDYGASKDSGGGAPKDDEDEDEDEYEESKLTPEVQSLVQLICDVNMIRASLLKQGCDLEKMPLGKISKNMVDEGFKALKALETELEGKKNAQVLLDLSSRFYTVVPHDFGFQKMQNFVINSMDKLKVKLDLVNDLNDLYAAHDVLDQRSQRLKARQEAQKRAEKLKTKQLLENPVDSQYSRLSCELQPLLLQGGSSAPEITDIVEKFVRNTHAQSHDWLKVKGIKQIFRVNRPEESRKFEQFHKNSCKKKSFPDNRALLWHGSRLTNWAGILSQGLRIAPPEAPVSGYMFDKGIYFADAFSKSAQYCRADRSKPTGLLLLCEVSLGKQKMFLSAQTNAASMIDYQQVHSTYGAGRSRPDPAAEANPSAGELKGVKVPQGSLVPNTDAGSSACLMYNEFIIYKMEQCRMRYLVEVEFNFR